MILQPKRFGCNQAWLKNIEVITPDFYRQFHCVQRARCCFNLLPAQHCSHSLVRTRVKTPTDCRKGASVSSGATDSVSCTRFVKPTAGAGAQRVRGSVSRWRGAGLAALISGSRDIPAASSLMSSFTCNSNRGNSSLVRRSNGDLSLVVFGLKPPRVDR